MNILKSLQRRPVCKNNDAGALFLILPTILLLKFRLFINCSLPSQQYFTIYTSWYSHYFSDLWSNLIQETLLTVTWTCSSQSKDKHEASTPWHMSPTELLPVTEHSTFDICSQKRKNGRDLVRKKWRNGRGWELPWSKKNEFMEKSKTDSWRKQGQIIVPYIM